MLQVFRSFVASKFGAAIAVVVLALIAFAFAAGDMAGMTGFGGGNDKVAAVGRQRIDGTALSQGATNALENLKQRDPRLSMKAFLAQGGLDRVLNDMLDRTALAVFGASHGITASERLIDSEIAKIPAFRGLDGNFSQTVFRQLLRQRGLSEKMVREDLAQGLVIRQVLEPAAFGSVVPRELALRYAALLKERRSGAIALLPSPLFAPRTPPGDKELADYYAANRARFIRPERRVIRYATFSDDALKTVAAPSDVEIASYYNANKRLYAAIETRQLVQLVVPTEAAARTIAGEVAGGKTLQAAAAAKGLATSTLRSQDKAGLTQASAPAVADAAFAAAEHALSTPARSAIGWHLFYVEGVQKRPERTLDQARGEIATTLSATKRRAALNDLTGRLEEEFDKGGNLTDAAKDLGLTLQQTPALTADGKSYVNPAETVAPVIAKVASAAFAMEKENAPQLAEVEAGKTFIIFDVSDIAASAPAPLAEIRNDIAIAWALDKGAAAAKAAAEKLLAEVHKGTPLAQAAAALKLPLPPVQTIDMNRVDLTKQGQTPPPPLVLLFSMAEGTAKILPAAGARGWFVVALKDIVPGAIAPNDPLLPSAQRELGQLVGNEYAEQLRRAVRAEVKVTKNEDAIRAVRTQLGGGN